MKKTLLVFAGVVVVCTIIALSFWWQKRTPDITKEPFAGLIIPTTIDEPTKREMERKINQTKAIYADKPEHWETWIAIGNLRNVFGDYKGAIKAYEKSVKIEPSNVIGYHNIAEVYFTNLKDYSKAAEYYRQAIEKNPFEPDNYAQLSLVQNIYLGKAEDAEKTLLEGLEKKSNDPVILISLARFYKERGDIEKYNEYQAKFDKAKADREGKEPDSSTVTPVNIKVN